MFLDLEVPLQRLTPRPFADLLLEVLDTLDNVLEPLVLVLDLEIFGLPLLDLLQLHCNLVVRQPHAKSIAHSLGGWSATDPTHSSDVLLVDSALPSQVFLLHRGCSIVQTYLIVSYEVECALINQFWVMRQLLLPDLGICAASFEHAETALYVSSLSKLLFVMFTAVCPHLSAFELPGGILVALEVAVLISAALRVELHLRLSDLVHLCLLILIEVLLVHILLSLLIDIHDSLPGHPMEKCLLVLEVLHELHRLELVSFFEFLLLLLDGLRSLSLLLPCESLATPVCVSDDLGGC